MKYIYLLTLLTSLAACGNSQLETVVSPDPTPSPQSGKGYASFSLGSDFPADLDIPDIDGMRSTAFIVSTTNPSGVIAVDIDARPMKISERFKGVISPNGSGVPNNLVIASPEEAFLLTSSSIVSFNPQTGDIYQVANANEQVDIGSPRTNSFGVPVPATITPSFPGGMAIIGRNLYITNANYAQTFVPAIANPGIVQVFAISADHRLHRTSSFVTSCFNPTGLTVRSDRELLITHSGVIDILDAHGRPQTESCIDIVDTATNAVTSTLRLGNIGASFRGVALTRDGTMGFLGSATSGKLYQLDFLNRRWLRGSDDPFLITDEVDFLSDAKFSANDGTLFVSSFEQSSIFMLDASSLTPSLSAEHFVVGFPAGVTEQNPSGANTGIGAIAVRPGTRGEDYQNEDLFVLTGYPGKLVAIDSGKPAQEPTLQEDPSETITPPAPPTGNQNDACQSFVQAVTSFTPGSGAGFGQASLPSIVLGPPEGTGEYQGSNHVVSLGTSGSIVLDMGNCRIVNKSGPDFIVFENSFYVSGNSASPYAELGKISVSSDGATFVDFPCQSTLYPYVGCAGWHPVLSNSTNGISPFDPSVSGGEAFDLDAIGISEARYIRIEDMSGIGFGNAKGIDHDANSIINGKIQ
ncbi:MAG: hypothetical protein HY540_04670 [Deltaproteobacteria bacterium]|nr:hypothetical protein [Deltaproteobacteria bacterium]